MTRTALGVCTLIIGFFFAACAENMPHITGISPKFGSEGDIITISGSNFGNGSDRSYLTIAGERPTASTYLLWQDDMIKVRIARPGMSGLVYVFAEGRQSNGVLFRDRAAIPEIPRTTTGKGLTISAITPRQLLPGGLVTITGSGFGAARGGAEVTFTWNTSGRTERQELPVSVFEGGYESWGEREIRVRVPDGAGSGIAVVKTEGGAQAAVTAELAEGRGRKIMRDGRDYLISFSTDVTIQEAAVPNTFYLAMPLPVQTASQRITRVVSRSVEPFVADHQGTALFQFIDVRPGDNRRVSVSLVTSVYGVETSGVQPAAAQDTSLAVYKSCLAASPLIPAADSAIVEKAASITGRERNPYLKAQLIFNALVKELTIAAAEPGTAGASALAALRTGEAGPAAASLLFCALSRAAGIPAAPLAGVLVLDGQTTAKHYWAAFWIDGLGWLPVDLALAAGAAPAGWTLRPDYALWYFANIDNRHIAFSFGETVLSPVDSRSRVISRDKEYALQNIWEEVSDGIVSYSSLWSGVTIEGVYYH